MRKREERVSTSVWTACLTRSLPCHYLRISIIYVTTIFTASEVETKTCLKQSTPWRWTTRGKVYEVIDNGSFVEALCERMVCSLLEGFSPTMSVNRARDVHLKRQGGMPSFEAVLGLLNFEI